MTACGAGALAATFTMATSSASADEPKKLKIFLSLSYSGNAWQSEAANIVKALAQTPPYDKMVELKEVLRDRPASSDRRLREHDRREGRRRHQLPDLVERPQSDSQERLQKGVCSCTTQP
jgi:hypothetical protein